MMQMGESRLKLVIMLSISTPLKKNGCGGATQTNKLLRTELSCNRNVLC